MTTRTSVDVKAFIDERGLASIQWLLPVLCFFVVAVGMLGMGRFGSIAGSLVGGVLLAMGWGFTTIIPLLAVPAVLAGVAVLKARRADVDAPAAGAQSLAHS